eukprot:m.429374 g.429374  ORF g.429374 m.429374 type:complete len:511 (+) comp56716_c0_seq2:316-1848(+)
MDSGTVALPDHMFAPQHLVLCCECGVPILPNPANTCVNCLRIRFDISAGIPKQSTMYHCRGCERYLHPPGTWVAATLESRELLALCLKRLRGLNKVRLVDAGFIWTEPHSKRIKVKLTIQQEIYSGTLLQQIFVVEYIINNQMCDNCHRREANDTWNAVVQVRQKVPHKKTFFFLEQLMIKHRAHQKTIKVKATPDGLDFFYASRQDAKHFCDFLQAVVPMRMKTSERLISHDIQSNISNYKFTFSVEIVPICKDDVVCLPLPISKMCGTMAQIVICDRVGSSLHFIDPLTLQREEVSGDVYWRYPFQSIMSAAKLIEYMVMDIEPVRDASGRPVVVGKYALAEVTVARERDVSANDTQFITRTHLGPLLGAWSSLHSCLGSGSEKPPPCTCRQVISCKSEIWFSAAISPTRTSTTRMRTRWIPRRFPKWCWSRRASATSARPTRTARGRSRFSRRKSRALVGARSFRPSVIWSTFSKILKRTRSCVRQSTSTKIPAPLFPPNRMPRMMS